MPDDKVMNPTEILTAISPAAAVAAAVAAWFGIVSARSYNRAQAQPSLVAEMSPGRHSNDTIELVIRNVGPTPARGVRVTFDPPLPGAGDADKGSKAWILRQRYTEAIPVIGPGQSFRNTWWLSDFGAEDPSTRNQWELPNKVTITFEYSGIGSKRLTGAFPLQARLLLLEGRAVQSSSTLGRMGGIEAALKSIDNKMD